MTFYHGTTKKRASRIIRGGLRTKYSCYNGRIFLSSNYEEAQGYGVAMLTVDLDEDDPNLEKADGNDWEYIYLIDIDPMFIDRAWRR